MGVPRGIRNNNPGNIEFSKRNNWTGQVGSDGRFAQFSDMKFGIRALTKLLANYHKQGNFTVRKIINKYAPSNENNTLVYIETVCDKVGIGADEYIVINANLVNGHLARLVGAIIHHENGQDVKPAELVDGLTLGFSSLGIA